MRLTFEQFKKKVRETKQKIAQAISVKEGTKLPGKKSQTRLRAERRAWKSRPRAACDSQRYRQKHHGDNRRHPARDRRVEAAARANNARKKADNVS